MRGHLQPYPRVRVGQLRSHSRRPSRWQGLSPATPAGCAVWW
uniref:Uncharacterized protein n=1 Tax=Arundo donax TaxID=35708 RepID=A0A0A9ADP0_ARUDO